MTQNIKAILNSSLLLRGALFTGALILAYDPVTWLINSWRDPSYDSAGIYIFALCIGLFSWSVSTPRLHPSPEASRLAIWLLLATAIVRLAGQMLAVNVIGAFALVIDVYAIALLCGLNVRKRPLSPAWLAISFAFALPLERMIQRTIGFGLQNISADGACFTLGLGFDNVVCHGIRIVVAGKDVLVDLPCSGARALLLLLLFFAVCASFARPTLRQALFGASLALVSALIANIVRITWLASGIARPDLMFNVDVMAQPWHDLIGLTTVALGCAPVIAWALRVHDRSIVPVNKFDRNLGIIPDRILKDGWWLAKPITNPRYLPKIIPAQALIAIGFIAAAVAIVSAPRKAFDVARPIQSIQLPVWLNGTAGRHVSLSPREKQYFVQYGGAAAKASYGDQSLLVVRTSAPLRHLHAPDECLRGLGLDVRYMGARFTPVPTAVYRAVETDGTAYRIEVSFKSDTGAVTTNVSHAVWLWLQNPKSNWTAVQRITPWEQPLEKRVRLERAVASYFNLAPQPKSATISHLPPTRSAKLEGASIHD